MYTFRKLHYSQRETPKQSCSLKKPNSGWSLKSNASGWEAAEESNQDASAEHSLAGSCAVYQFQCVLRPSTRGSTRPQGSLWCHSHLDPHTPAPRKTQTPFHIYTHHTGLGSRSDCWSRLCHPLYRNLCGKKQQLPSVTCMSWTFSFLFSKTQR